MLVVVVGENRVVQVVFDTASWMKMKKGTCGGLGVERQ